MFQVRRLLLEQTFDRSTPHTLCHRCPLFRRHAVDPHGGPHQAVGRPHLKGENRAGVL